MDLYRKQHQLRIVVAQFVMEVDQIVQMQNFVACQMLHALQRKDLILLRSNDVKELLDLSDQNDLNNLGNMSDQIDLIKVGK